MLSDMRETAELKRPNSVEKSGNGAVVSPASRRRAVSTMARIGRLIRK